MRPCPSFARPACALVALLVPLAPGPARAQCEPPSAVRVRPASTTTASPRCRVDRTFTVLVDGTTPFSLDWTVEPPPGGSATPSSGTIAPADGLARFTSTLEGRGTHLVRVSASNDCGSETGTLPFELEDKAAPDLTCTAEVVGCVVPIAPWRGPRSEPLPSPRPPALERASSPAPTRAEPSPGAPGSAPEPEAKLAEASRLRFEREASVDLGRPAPPASAMALGCATPCDDDVVEATGRFYELFAACDDGAFTARTGAEHPVTLASGERQNVIFGGETGAPITSDVAFHVHETGTTYVNPLGGQGCAFDPPDTESEPDSTGVEVEWTRSPRPGLDLVLREEVVTFGTEPSDSGLRLTLSVTNLATSVHSATIGLRWQVDYENAEDDGPLFAPVRCDPFEVHDERGEEHELAPDEVQDFFRMRNNTGSPVFSNFSSTTELDGFPDSRTPDRLIYGEWSRLRLAPWDFAASEGDPGPDTDSAVLYYVGAEPEDAVVVEPGGTLRRSILLFTNDDGLDCGGFVPGASRDVQVEACPGSCVELGAEAADNCGDVTVRVASASPGAPPCDAPPCLLEFPAEGTYEYELVAEDASGNVTSCTSVVRVVDEEPPRLLGVPADAVVECDAVPAPAPVSAEDDCDPAPSVELQEVRVDGPCPGDHELRRTWIATDASGNTAEATRVLRVVDTTPPVVRVGSGGVECLWPPSHRKTCWSRDELAPLIDEACSEPVSWRFVGCTSSQPDDAPRTDRGSPWNGDGHTLEDCTVEEDGETICVRAERAGRDRGRVGRSYGVLVEAVDACGNSSGPVVAATVRVPHDGSRRADPCGPRRDRRR